MPMVTGKERDEDEKAANAAAVTFHTNTALVSPIRHPSTRFWTHS